VKVNLRLVKPVGWKGRPEFEIVNKKQRQLFSVFVEFIVLKWSLLSIYGVDTGVTWRIRLNRPCAAAMRPYAKLPWPLVNCYYRRHYETF